MSRRQRAVYRLVARLLPADFRERRGAELEDTALTCLRRERDRLGRLGVVVAWAAILADVTITALALRRPETPVRDILQEIHMPRLMRGHRGYALLTVSSLSLAVGATLAVFTVVNALWLTPSAIPDADRIVMVVGGSDGEGDTVLYAATSLESGENWPMFDSVAGQLATSGQAARQAPRLVLDAAGADVEVLGVTSRYFELLGQAVRGRDFSREDSLPGAEPVAIISERLWSRAFDRRDDVIGALASATPFAVRIVGVAPAGFDGARRGERTDIWLPAPLAVRLSPTGATETDPGGAALLLARLRPGQTPDEARQQLIERALAGTRVPPGPSLDRYREGLELRQVVRLSSVFGSPSSRTIVISEGRAAGVVAGLAGLVLVGSCATLMALVLVHYERRRRELSVRLALGASRLRLAAQLVVEFGWLAAAGTIGAVLVALAGLEALPAFSLPGGVDLSRLDLAIDWRVLGVAITTTTLTLAAAATVPLLRFTRGELAGEIVAVRSTTSASSQRLRQALLALQVSATIVVLVSAGLFVRAVGYGFSEGPGFDVDRVLSVRLRLPPIQARPGATIPDQLAAVHQRMLELEASLGALPGVTAVASGDMPIGLDRMNDALSVETLETGGVQRELAVGHLVGAPRLTDALGVPVVSGRSLSENDDAGRGGVAPVVITASLARTLWPDADPVGRDLLVDPVNGGRRYQVIGVIRDLAYGSMTQPTAGVIVRVFENRGILQSFVVRVENPRAAVQPVRGLIERMVPDAHRLVIATGRDIVAQDLGPQRLGAWFFSGFGVIALVLGAGGVFGLVAYLAESRRREFGVRVALGATPRDLVRRSVGAGLVPVGIGAGAGLGSAAIVARLFETTLPGLSPLDPLTYAGVALLMTACAAAASLSAAWRLRRLAPVDALRAE